MANNQEKLLREAFKYQETLESYANAILHNWNLSKDAVQEAYILTSLKWQDVEEDFLFAWLKKITRDKAYDIIRKQTKQTAVQTEIKKLVNKHFESYLDEEIHEEHTARMKTLETCMKKLRPECLNLMVGFYREQKSCEALAGTMNRTVNAVRILLHRTRDNLRRCVKTKSPEHE
ncbi:MAG: sigma-70 family RNA polymerase sigma factor [Lentisphaeraceae bacterium]|nr:sigma-70 family RNA polymerase sigma factor [Lentisphaeraceae bacterium]